MKQALLLIDIQNDYFPNGSMELVGMDLAADNAARVLQAYRTSGQGIFHIQHISTRPGSTFFLPDTEGVATHQSVAPRSGETVVQKYFPNSFRETSLLDSLHTDGIEDLIICGAMSHMCVDSTVRAAFDYGFKCTVVHDACATRDLSFNGEVVLASSVQAAFMAALAVPYARVVGTVDILEPREPG